MLIRPRHYLLRRGCIYSVPSPADCSITMIYLPAGCYMIDIMHEYSWAMMNLKQSFSLLSTLGFGSSQFR